MRALRGLPLLSGLSVFQIAWLDWLEELFCSADVTHEINHIKVKITRISIIMNDPKPGSSEFFIHCILLCEKQQQDYSGRHCPEKTATHDEQQGQHG